MLSALLALASGVFWGTADFLGGSTARRLPVTTVVVASSVPAVLLLVVAVPVLGGLERPGAYLGWAVGYGVVGFIAISAFYRALADGTMGVVAPIAATGVILLAAVAAVGFGLVLTFLERGSATSVGMTLLVARTFGLLLAMVVAMMRRAPVTGWRPHWPALQAMGIFDVLANAAYAVATHTGLLSVVAVFASLYPVVTVLLARHVHDERLTGLQAAGVTASLAGVVLMAAG